MATKFVSPGVFTEELDQSFLGQGVEQIGSALLGLTEKGPAFVPVRVSNFNEYAEIFGDLNSDFMLGYAARAYLRNSAGANVVRILGPAGRTANGAAVNPGFTAESTWAIVAQTGSTTGRIHALLEITGAADLVITDLTNDQFYVEISGTVAAMTDPPIAVTASFLTSSSNYIKKVLNTDPTLFTTKGYYVREVYDYVYKKHVNGNAVYGSASYSSMNTLQSGFMSASTPWIKSQEYGGVTEYNLFKVHTLGHGKVENGRFKVSVSNVKVSPVPSTTEFGTFTLLVRNFLDSDKSVATVESFENLDLNPTSRNYLLKRVGDQFWNYDATNDKMILNGDYPNQSKFVRLELNTGSYPDDALPWGFKGLARPDLTLNSGSVTPSFGLNATVSSSIEPLPYVGDLKDKEVQAEPKDYIYWGVEMDLSGSVVGRLSLLPVLTGSDPDFSLKLVSGSSGTATPGAGNQGLQYDTTLVDVASKKGPGTTTSHTVLEPKYAKFTVPLAFGFDGFNPKHSNPIDNELRLTAVSDIGTQAVRQAIDTIKDPDFIDINLLAIPGIYSDQVVEYGIDQIENRADALYIIDVSGSTVSSVTTEVKGRGFDSIYAAVYYPDINVVDNVNGKIVRLPSSIAAVGAISYNDRIAFPWFAPAGLNRGGLTADTFGFTVTRPVDQLKASERDDLYENRINPIARFPGVPGATIWGQKTLQVKASALDRVNVRRLLIRAKKLIAAATKFLVFEPNNASTWTQFKQLVNPILQDIQIKNGLEAFRVVMDSTVTTPDLIDRNIMKGVIQLIPTRSAEFIQLSFVISRSGAAFEE